MNTLVKTSTGVSPNELIFATSANHDNHFWSTPELTTSYKSHHEHTKEFVEAQERIIKIAQENQEEHDIYVITERSKYYSHTSYFSINSYVLLQQHETQKSSKLHNMKHGPCSVLSHVGTVYTVEILVTKVICDFHVKLSSEYKHDMKIDRVANLDDEYSDIVDLLNHRYEPKYSMKRSNLEYLLT